VATEDDENGTNERANALRKAYGQATARLRGEHREEFDQFYAEAAKELGVDYKPRPTAEQKAEETFEALLEEYPHLRDKIAESA